MNPFDPRSLSGNYGPGFTSHRKLAALGLIPYPNFHDPGGSWQQGEPGLVFVRDALRSGQLPFWDPFVGGGAPAFANLTCAFLFPPQILLSVAGASSLLKNLYILLIFWTGAFGTYVLLRQHHVSAPAAAAGGLAFLFSGGMQQAGPTIFLGQVIASMPLLLVSTRWFLNRPTWRRTGCLALIYAVISLATFPPLILAAFGFVVIYTAVVLFLDRNERNVRALRFATAVAIAIGMAMIVYAPSFAAVAASEHAVEHYEQASGGVLTPTTIFQLLFPTATGGATIYNQPVMDDRGPHLFYTGVVVLLLAIAACGRSEPSVRPLSIASAVYAVLILMKLYGFAEWVALIPGLRTFHYAAYFGISLAFIADVLAGAGLDRLIRREATLSSALTATAIVVAGLVGVRVLAAMTPIAGHPQAWRWLADFRVAALFAGLASLLIVGATLARNRRLQPYAGYVLLVLVFIEGVTNSVYPRQPRFDVFASLPPYVRAMQTIGQGSRFITVGVLPANLGNAVRVSQIDSLWTFVSTRMYDIYWKYASPKSDTKMFMRRASALPPEALLDRAAVRFVAARKNASWSSIEAQAVRRGYPIVWQDGFATIFRRGNGAARAAFSSLFTVVGRRAALDLVANAPSEQIILETDPGIVSVENQPGDPRPQIKHASLNRVTVTLHAPRPGLLYLADVHFPGWSATVNGRRADILIANYAFRAVAVPAGDAIVEFSYWPPGLNAGLVIAAISLAACVCCLFVPDRSVVPPVPVSS